MGNVVSLFEKKADKITPEQRMKAFCIRQMLDENTANHILERMTIDEAFSFLADRAVEWGLIKADGNLNK